MIRPLTVAQAGCGYWGPNLLRVFNAIDGCRVKWLCELKPGRLAWAKKSFPRLRLSSSYDELLADPEVDAIVLATEVVSHYGLAKAALSAGKHVFVEKPLAHTLARARELSALAKRKRLALGVGHVFLYNPGIRALQAELRSGRLGKLCYLDSARVNPGPPQPRHDVIWDMAPHDAALALALSGGRPVSVRAHGGRWLNGRLDEAAFIDVRFSNAVLAHIHVSWMSSRRIRRLEAYGTKGSAFFDDAEPREKLKIVSAGKDTRKNASAKSNRVLYYGPGETRVPALPPVEPLRAECEDFVAAARASPAAERP